VYTDKSLEKCHQKRAALDSPRRYLSRGYKEQRLEEALFVQEVQWTYNEELVNINEKATLVNCTTPGPKT
jgi:hypothetical protein